MPTPPPSVVGMSVPTFTLNNGLEIPVLGFGVFQTPPAESAKAPPPLPSSPPPPPPPLLPFSLLPLFPSSPSPKST